MTHQQIERLDITMEHIVKDTEHFLKDLKGQKRLKGLVKKDAQHLKEHLQKMREHVVHIEARHAE